MTQKLPLPITAAMLAKANQHEAKPRYDTPADWHGNDSGNDVDVAEALQAIANSHSAFVEVDYDPQHQEAKADMMVPPRTILSDLGKDYGEFGGGNYRDGTIQPRQPYPTAVLE